MLHGPVSDEVGKVVLGEGVNPVGVKLFLGATLQEPVWDISFQLKESKATRLVNLANRIWMMKWSITLIR